MYFAARRQHQINIYFSDIQIWSHHIYCSDAGDGKYIEGHMSSLSEQQSVCPSFPQQLMVCGAGKLLCERGDSPQVGFLPECRAGHPVPPQAASGRQLQCRGLTNQKVSSAQVRPQSPGASIWCTKVLQTAGAVQETTPCTEGFLANPAACRGLCMRENTTMVGASLWHHSFWSARNPMPPHTFPSIHPCHPGSCHCLQFPF